MLVHFINYLVSALHKMPYLVGSNWGGVTFALVLFAGTEFLLWRFGNMKWGKNTLISIGVVIVAWTGLFMLSAFLTLYDDHQNFVGATARIKRTIRMDADQVRGDLNQELTSAESQRGLPDSPLKVAAL